MSIYIKAAVQVLREEKRPLHYEEITRLALERGLLKGVNVSHPEVTMAARLSFVAKQEGASIVRAAFGVFQLREE